MKPTDFEMKDAKFLTTKEKTMILKQWTAFIRSGFKWEKFSDRLYKHLHLHCDFIAHFDRRGFWCTYFDNPEDTIRFISHFDRDKQGLVIVWGEYVDINGAMLTIMDEYKQYLYQKYAADSGLNDLALAKQLLAKHGIEVSL